MSPRWGLTPRQTGRLTVDRNVTLTLTSVGGVGVQFWSRKAVLEDCNRATTSKGCNKVRRLVWVVAICAAS
jgi:hypothetical protein